jgi:hypothetical protein
MPQKIRIPHICTLESTIVVPKMNVLFPNSKQKQPVLSYWNGGMKRRTYDLEETLHAKGVTYVIF